MDSEIRDRNSISLGWRPRVQTLLRRIHCDDLLTEADINSLNVILANPISAIYPSRLEASLRAFYLSAGESRMAHISGFLTNSFLDSIVSESLSKSTANIMMIYTDLMAR